MGSNVPVVKQSRNEMIYEMNHIANCGLKTSQAKIVFITARIVASIDFMSCSSICDSFHISFHSLSHIS